MAFALISSVAAGSPDGETFTSGSIDTTGANLLVLCVASYDAEANPVISDSKSNTWTPRTGYENNDGGPLVKIHYAENPASVGAGHTFTVTGALRFASVGVLAFSGAVTSSVYDGENGNAPGSVATIQPGSVTPSQDNDLLVCMVGSDTSITETINSSFIKELDVNLVGGAHYGLAVAYKIQTSAGAENPTWTLGATVKAASAMAAFKAAGGGATVTRKSSGLLLAGCS